MVKPRCEREEPLHVCQSLRSIEGSRDNRHVFRVLDRVPQQVADGVMVTARNQALDKMRGTIEQLMFFVADEGYLAMPSQSLKQPAGLCEMPQRITAVDFCKPGRATQRKQSVI